MKLAELVSVFFKEDKHKIYTFLGNKVRISLWTYHGTGHVLFSTYMYANLSFNLLFAGWYVNGELNILLLLKETFDKQDSIF